MSPAEWIAMAIRDAERRGLPGLRAVLEGLVRATTQLRRAPWNDDASGTTPGRQ